MSFYQRVRAVDAAVRDPMSRLHWIRDPMTIVVEMLCLDCAAEAVRERAPGGHDVEEKLTRVLAEIIWHIPMQLGTISLHHDSIYARTGAPTFLHITWSWNRWSAWPRHTNLWREFPSGIALIDWYKSQYCE